MSNTPKNISDDQEIDLSQISKKLGQTYESFLSWIFSGFLFIKRNIIVLGILFIIGAALGFYLDKSDTVYNHNVIITPNFGSTEYVYSKVDLINSKIKEGDTVFLNTIGIKNADAFAKIEIEPVTDLYGFINANSQNFEMIKLMAEDGDITKIIKDETTSKNYTHHILKIITSGEVTQEGLIDPILNYLNTSEYYSEIQKSVLESIEIKIESNKKTISQIDSLLNNFSKAAQKNAVSDRLLYYNNENSQVNEILKTKNDLIQEQASRRIELITSDKVIKKVSSVLNIKNSDSLNGKMKFVIPFLFISLFILMVLIMGFYKSQMRKLKQ